MARNPAGKGGGNWLKTLLFVGLAIGGLAAGAVILQPMLSAPSADVALIKAEPGPFREKPKDPGGTRIPHTDSTVMTMLGGGGDKQEDVEILQPPANVPEMPPLPAKPDEAIVMAPAPAPVMESPVMESPAAEIPATESPAKESNAATPAAADMDDGAADNTDMAPPAGQADGSETAQADMADGSAASTAEDAVADGGDEQSSPTADTEVAAPLQTIPTPKPAAPKRPKVEGDEPFSLVQLAAFRNANTAREQAAMLVGKHLSRLGDIDLGTMKVDAGENGIFWRVITEPLDRTDADSLCSALKRAGQDCILRKFDDPS